MKAALAYLLASIGLSTASSVVLGDASQSHCFYEKPSLGTQVLDVTANNIRGQGLLGLQRSPCDSKKILQSLKTTSEDQNNIILTEPTTTRLQPNSIRGREHKSGSKITSSWGQSRKKKIRQEKSLPELATEALLKLQNLSGDKQTRTLVTFDILLPLAQSTFSKLKEWDHPIGQAVKVFDDAVAALQRNIGGEQVPEIYGNTLKLRMICFLRDEQQFKNDVDKACQRLHGQNEQHFPQEENKMRNLLSQLFEGCVQASTNANQQNDLLQHCEELSRQTLELEAATEELITFRQQVRQRLQNGGQVEHNDIDEAARLIRKGGFGTLNRNDSDWATKMAAWYLDDVIDSTELNENNQPSLRVLPTWVTKTSIRARDIPQDQATEVKALQIISNGPYRGVFTDREQFQGGEMCWSASGLGEYKPYDWDKLSAALIYVDTSLRTLQLACKSCESTKTLDWQLRCGSTKG